MGGDLNLKKSWHPSLMSNQKKVWEEEKKALDERKKIDQIRKEREEERQVQDLQQLQEAAGGRKRQVRVDWMYSGPSDGQTGTTEENEAYLLGKRRVDTLLQGKEKEVLQKSTGQDSFMALQSVNTAKDAVAKIRDDPLLAIKKQEQAAYEAMMNDPVKRRMLLKAAGKEEPTIHERKRRKHHHSSSHRHDRSPERRSRHRSSRDDDHQSSRHQSRRDRNLSYSRSPSPKRSQSQKSPPRSRGYSPGRDTRERSRSPFRDSERSRDLQRARSWHKPERRSLQRSVTPQRRTPSPDEEDNVQAKLAAMQQDATDLDVQRQRRLEDIARRDRLEAEQEEKKRAHNSRYGGGRADFVNGFHKRAGELNLSDRMDRRRHSERDTLGV